MGTGASAGVAAATQKLTDNELAAVLRELPADQLQRLTAALGKAEAEVARCYCGEVTVSCQGEPAMQVFCHCAECRKFGGALGMAAKFYPADKVTVKGELHPGHKMEGSSFTRKSCGKCGGFALNDCTEAMKMYCLPAGCFDSPFNPSFTFFCKERILALKYGVDQFKGVAPSMGGPDEKVADDFVLEAKEEEQVTCLCGAVKITVKGEPAVQTLCHCDDCRRWTGCMAMAAKLYPADAVTVSGDLLSVAEQEGKVWRRSCAKCGGRACMYMKSFGMTMVPAGLFNSPFKPTMHIMYKMKLRSVKDGLPKFSDCPKDMGGSDETLDE